MKLAYLSPPVTAAISDALTGRIPNATCAEFVAIIMQCAGICICCEVDITHAGAKSIEEEDKRHGREDERRNYAVAKHLRRHIISEVLLHQDITTPWRKRRERMRDYNHGNQQTH